MSTSEVRYARIMYGGADGVVDIPISAVIGDNLVTSSICNSCNICSW